MRDDHLTFNMMDINPKCVDGTPVQVEYKIRDQHDELCIRAECPKCGRWDIRGGLYPLRPMHIGQGNN